MTEQIKDSMETCRIIVHATEEELVNQYRYNDAKEIEVALNDMLKAFRSLQAWEEILQELEKETEDLNLHYVMGIEKAIDIINKHLAEIEEVR